jgi:polar amino acid transport system substrate-binding protein
MRRRKPEVVPALLALTLAAWLGCAPGQAAPPAATPGGSEAAPDVVVPNSWDPGATLDKPDLSTLQSIHFLTEDDHPPFGFTLADGTLVGFDVDLARAICEDLALVCTIQARRYDTLVGALKAGAGDAAIASMAITPQALRDVDFTAPYYRTPARFAARREMKLGEILPETIGTARVGVVAGSAHEAYLKTFFPTARAQSFASSTELEAALLSGGIDLVFGDAITLAEWMNTPEGSPAAFVSGPFTESRYFGEGAGIAVKKGNAILRTALDHALAHLAAKGLYADLYLKYFPISVY